MILALPHQNALENLWTLVRKYIKFITFNPVDKLFPIDGVRHIVNNA